MKSLVRENQDGIAPFSKILSDVAKKNERDMSDGTPVITINEPEYAEPDNVRLTPLREEKITITWPQFVSGIFFFVLIGMAMMASLSLKISGWRPLFFILGLGVGYAGRILYQHYKRLN